MPNEERLADVVRGESQRDPEAHKAPGTFVLALLFLLVFVVYFYANWKALADVWHVR